MTKSKHAKPQEFEREQIRNLKKQLKQAHQTIRSLEKELGYKNITGNLQNTRKNKEINLDQCENCGKGIIETKDYGVRKITTCSLCAYRKVSK